MGTIQQPCNQPISIIDIRKRGIGHSILDDFFARLNPKDGGERQLSTMLLYDERGLQLFERITHLKEYYLTNAEIEILEANADVLAEKIEQDSMLIELGSGNLRKVKVLLEAFERARKSISYFALDLSKSELERTLIAVQGLYRHVRCHGLLGTYEDGLDWLSQSEHRAVPKTILSMGSSIGNFPREDAAKFLASYAVKLSSQDNIIIGLDACQNANRVYHAYNDGDNITHQFILNGLVHANRLLAEDVFKLDEWKVIGEYDVQHGRHQAFLVPKVNVDVRGIRIHANERIRIEESYKYSSKQSSALWRQAGLQPQMVLGDSQDEYHLHVLRKQDWSFGLLPEQYAVNPLPSLDEFEQLWSVWDMVTCCMIPHEEMISKPIKLRNACIFYLGHIPAFLDMHITKATETPATPPASYHALFERGIDPDVDNPELCHAHSEIPAQWPSVPELHSYRDDVRERVRSLFAFHHGKTSPRLARALWLAFEHEAMHLETLLYMLIQSDKMLPPQGIQCPDFAAMFRKAEMIASPAGWLEIPERSISIGMSDPETDSGSPRYFGWDNEKPKRQVRTHAFQTKARPLTNGDYAMFLQANSNRAIPASWMRKQYNGSDPRLEEHSASPQPQNTHNLVQSILGEKPVLNGHGDENVPPSSDVKHKVNGIATKAASSNTTQSNTNMVSNGTKFSSSAKIALDDRGIDNTTSNNISHAPVISSESHHPESLYKSLTHQFLSDKQVRTVFGAVSLQHALHWPVFASYDELTACAAWYGGRIPTEHELRTIFDYAEQTGLSKNESILARKFPAVNGHLTNGGVEISPPNGLSHSINEHKSQTKEKPSPAETFANLEGCNVGFRNFHPTPITAFGSTLAGRGMAGGVWEWTSTTLTRHDGFIPGSLYPAYTDDFFDGKHNVVLGGSWATHPRIAGRRSFVNWYQRNYPYAWCGARIVRDI